MDFKRGNNLVMILKILLFFTKKRKKPMYLLKYSMGRAFIRKTPTLGPVMISRGVGAKPPKLKKGGGPQTLAQNPGPGQP